MKRWNNDNDYQETLENCGFPKASTMPEGVATVAGWSGIDTLDGREAFKQHFYACEAGKLYATVSREGKVLLIKNPIVWEEINHGNGKRTRIRPPPIPLENYTGPRSEKTFVARTERQLNMEL